MDPLRQATIRLASQQPKGSQLRKDLLKVLADFDPDQIGGLAPGALDSESDEPYMGDNFTQQEFDELSDMQEGGKLAAALRKAKLPAEVYDISAAMWLERNRSKAQKDPEGAADEIMGHLKRLKAWPSDANREDLLKAVQRGLKKASGGPDPRGRGWAEKTSPLRWVWSGSSGDPAFTVMEVPSILGPLYKLMILLPDGSMYQTFGQKDNKEHWFKRAADLYKRWGSAAGFDLSMTPERWSKVGKQAASGDPLRAATIRLASAQPKGSTLRKALLEALAADFDADRIGDVSPEGALEGDPDESYMSEHFTGQEFDELSDKQEGGHLPGPEKKYAGEAALRSAVIRLAHENPSMRPLLLPVLKDASIDPDLRSLLKGTWVEINWEDVAAVRLHQGRWGVIMKSGLVNSYTDPMKFLYQLKNSFQVPPRMAEKAYKQLQEGVSSRLAAKEPAKLKGKKLEKEIDRLFKVHGDRVQFDIFDLGKLSNDVKAAYEAGGDMEEAMKKAVAKYRKN